MLNNQIDNLLEGGDVIPILLSGVELELPLDLHDEAGQVIVDDLKVVDEICLFRDLASVDEANDIDEQLKDLFADFGSSQITFHFLPHRRTYQY